MGLIIFIIIIVVIVANVNSKGKNTKGNVNRPVQNRPVQNNGIINEHFTPVEEKYNNAFVQEKLELRQRAAKRLEAKKKADNKNILQRAKTSVAEDFGQSANEMNRKASDAYNRQKEISQKVNEKLNMEQNFCQEEESELIKVVEDLMIKGPDTSLTFERDFISEGLDMLNSIQA